MTSYKVKWQEQKPFGYLSAFKSIQQFSSLCRSLARYFLSYISILFLKEPIATVESLSKSTQFNIFEDLRNPPQTNFRF